jgi:type III pantothenate kinase
MTVGADRIINTLAASRLYGRDCIVVDLGTATTFDCITAEGVFIGGVIAPGVETSAETLTRKTSKLPSTELVVPQRAIGRRTEDCIRSGVIFGAADAIDGTVRRIKAEWPHREKPMVIATGGFAEMFGTICREFDRVEPYLTLQGLQMAHALLSSATADNLNDAPRRPRRRSK